MAIFGTRHYEAIAVVISEEMQSERDVPYGLITKLCTMFYQDNARFDQELFFESCKIWKSKMNYIRSSNFLNHGEYWSNTCGWVEFKEDATLFTDEETNTLNLPDGGHWENDRGKEE